MALVPSALDRETNATSLTTGTELEGLCQARLIANLKGCSRCPETAKRAEAAVSNLSNATKWLCFEIMVRSVVRIRSQNISGLLHPVVAPS